MVKIGKHLRKLSQN